MRRGARARGEGGGPFGEAFLNRRARTGGASGWVDATRGEDARFDESREGVTDKRNKSRDKQ